MGIWVVSSSLLLGIKLLQIFLCKSVCVCVEMYLYLLGEDPRVERLDHRVSIQLDEKLPTAVSVNSSSLEVPLLQNTGCLQEPTHCTL